MQIAEVMTREVGLIAPETTLEQAAQAMKKQDVGALPVAENDRLVGMLTDRDIVVKGIAEGLDPAHAPVRQAMSAEVLYCFDDQMVEEVALNMATQKIRRLPVVSREKRLVGIISLGDLANSGQPGAAAGALAEISEPGGGTGSTAA